MGEKLLVKNIGLLQTPVGSECHCGAQQGENQKLKNAAVLCEDGKITAVTADGALPAGSVVTTPGGCWLGRTAEAPRPDADGLTARALLTDTADLNGSVFFVKVS